MQEYFIGFLLGMVQGLTEFLPVSSDGHLALAEMMIAKNKGVDFSDIVRSPLAFNVFLHLATFLVTLYVLRKDICSLFGILTGKGDVLGQNAKKIKLLGVLLISTVPAGVVGVLYEDRIEELFGKIDALPYFFMLTSLVLYLAHKKLSTSDFSNDKVDFSSLDWELPSYAQAIMIGLAQAIAILPGVSRSGMTISCALLLGLLPSVSLRFSFLMALPVIFGAIVFKAKTMFEITPAEYALYLSGFFGALIGGYFAVKILLSAMQHLNLSVFSAYTFALALGIIFFVQVGAV